MGVLIVVSVMTIGLGAFLSAWAHYAEQSRVLKYALYVVYGGFAILLILLGAAVVAAPAVGADQDQSRIGYLLVSLGVAVGLPLVPWVRRALATVMPLDPKSIPDMVGLSLLTGLAVFFVYLTFFQATDVDISPVGTAELVIQSATFVALAFISVGTFMTRDLGDAMKRLGLSVPTARQVLIALGLVLVAFLISAAAGALTQFLQPELEEEIQRRLGEMTEHVRTVPGALTLGISAGLGEELLFRGAIQPRYGIVFTSLVFSLVHVQYGFSVIILGVFLLSIMLGIERDRMNTTASIITHSVYNTIAVLLGTG